MVINDLVGYADDAGDQELVERAEIALKLLS